MTIAWGLPGDLWIPTFNSWFNIPSCQWWQHSFGIPTKNHQFCCQMVIFVGLVRFMLLLLLLLHVLIVFASDHFEQLTHGDPDRPGPPSCPQLRPLPRPTCRSREAAPWSSFLASVVVCCECCDDEQPLLRCGFSTILYTICMFYLFIYVFI